MSIWHVISLSCAKRILFSSFSSWALCRFNSDLFGEGGMKYTGPRYTSHGLCLTRVGKEALSILGPQTKQQKSLLFSC